MDYMPKRWRDVRVVLIPKPGTKHSLVKSYHSINVSSFKLKILEKLMDKFLRKEISIRYPYRILTHA